MGWLRSPRTRIGLLLASAWLASATAQDPAGAAMTRAGATFLGALTPDQRNTAVFPFDGDERLKWHFIPTEMFPRKGLLIRSMTEPQRTLARDLLKAGLSQRGYLTATSIMALVERPLAAGVTFE